MINERKLAQMAAFFIWKQGSRISHLKLMKLLYLSEQEAVRLYAMPMINDNLVAMPHGPALSITLNLMDGDMESQINGWEEWISDKENHELSTKKKISREILDELSEAEFQLLENIWEKFGGMTQWEIRDYTHKQCSEWEDPHGSSRPISYKKLCKALGYSDDQSSLIEKNIQDQKQISNYF